MASFALTDGAGSGAVLDGYGGELVKERLRSIANEATDGINAILDVPLRPEQAEKAARIIEEAVIKALLEGQHRAVDAAIGCAEAEQDMAHKIANAIRQSNDALIANLKSLR